MNSLTVFSASALEITIIYMITIILDPEYEQAETSVCSRVRCCLRVTYHSSGLF